MKRRQQVGKENESTGIGNQDITLEPVARESTNACKNMDVPNARSLSSIVDCMIENNLYSGTHAIMPQLDTDTSNNDSSAKFVHFNYNITLHGYDPSKTIRKSRKVKKRLRKEYNA